MSGGQNETPRGWQADTGKDNRYATAAGTPKIAQSNHYAKRGGRYEIHPYGDGKPFTIKAKGREAWALERLIEAGTKGCTPLSEPAPRWSSYVHKLRERGVPIETVHEPHGGEFSGTHGRYILHARIEGIGGNAR